MIELALGNRGDCAVLNFHDIKSAVSIEQVGAWLGVETKKEGSQLRGPCPVCDDPDNHRVLALTPSKQLYFNHCAKHRGGGDCIQLASFVLGISQKDAAQEINKHFRATTPENKPVPTPDDVLKPLDYLQADHELCTRYGFSKEACERIGAGYASKGILRSRFLLPVRLPDGKLIGYIGVNDALEPMIKLPPSWKW